MNGSKDQNKRRVRVHCLASQSSDELVYARRRKETLEVTDSHFKKLSGMNIKI